LEQQDDIKNAISHDVVSSIGIKHSQGNYEAVVKHLTTRNA
jgi:hypothetical protein